MELGKRIKQLRKEQRRTQDDIAERCGFTVSLLSKIENGKTTPPVSTLVKIANALGVNVSDLLEERATGGPSFSTGADLSSSDKWIKTNKGYSFHAFASEFRDKKMQPFLFRAKKGEVKQHAFSHEGEEFIYMLEGRMKYKIGPIEYTLEPGDSIYFNSLEEHLLTPITEEAQYLAVFTEDKVARG